MHLFCWVAFQAHLGHSWEASLFVSSNLDQTLILICLTMLFCLQQFDWFTGFQTTELPFSLPFVQLAA